MARLLLMSGPGVSSCLLLLVAMFSAAVTDRTAKRDIVKTLPRVDTKKPATDLAPQESKPVQSQSPKKRHIRKFDFDAEFASYLGLASQSDVARYVAGDEDSSYRAPPSAIQDLPEININRPLRLIPGSTPASFAFFTQIYPDDHSDGDIRIEHFSPVIHPLSSEREKYRHRDTDDDEPEQYERVKSSNYANDAPIYSPPTSRSYFGRYSNKQKYLASPEDEGHKPRYQKTKNFNDEGHKPRYRKTKNFDDEGHKPSYQKTKNFNDEGHKPRYRKTKNFDDEGHKPSYQKTKNFNDDSTPDYKMGYRKFGMYHKFHEEDLYPKKTSSEWIPLKKYSKPNQDEPEDDHDARLSSDFHVSSEHDDEVDRIKSNINNDPPYSTNNFDLDETGKLKTKKTVLKEADHFSSEPQPVRRHKKKRKHRRKHHRPHHQGRPAFSSAPDNERFIKPERDSEYKAPSFEFHNPVNSYVSHPHGSPETNKNVKAKPFEGQPETHDGLKGFEPFRPGPEDDLPESAEADKDNSLEVTSDPSDEPADIDYGPIQLDKDDLEKDYHIIREAGPREHDERTKDFDKRLPEPDGHLYGSFETFDSQLDSTSKKKFEPFVQYPFDEQRQKLKTVVDDLIDSGKSR